MYELLDHTSEMGVRATASTVEEAFAETARGVLSIQVDRAAVLPDREIRVRAEGRDLEESLVEYLNALIARQDIEEVVLADVTAPRIEEGGEGFVVEGSAHGVAGEAAAEHRETEVKAVTYHGLRVEETEDGWRATVVVDV